MRKNRWVLSALTLVAAASVAVVPTGSAQAVNGKIGIHAATKTVIQGDTSRVKGKVVGAGKNVTVTIQQRRGSSGKDWGSGRQVKTDSKGKFSLDRVIKGKYTRDYRACIGPAGKRQCSLRARIEVVPSTTGIFVTQSPADVDAGAQITVRGSTDAALANHAVTLEQLDAKSLAWKPVATGTVTPAFTFELTGTPAIPGKNQKFRVTSPAFSGRSAVTVSSQVSANVYGFYSLTTYSAIQGGLKQGPATFQRPSGELVTYTSAVAPTEAANTATVNLAGNCNRLVADVFLDANTATADDAMNTSVVTATGANETVRYQQANIRKGDALHQVDVPLGNEQTLRITQTPANGANTDPVWYGNPFVACAY